MDRLRSSLSQRPNKSRSSVAYLDSATIVQDAIQAFLSFDENIVPAIELLWSKAMIDCHDGTIYGIAVKALDQGVKPRLLL